MSATNPAPAKHVSSDPNQEWYLLFPPQEPYSADRPPSMGGPLALSPMGGSGSRGAYEVHSMDRYEVNAPYDKWRKLGTFASQKDCENVRESQIKQAGDPIWIATHGPPSMGRPSASFMRGFFGMAKCAGADEMPPG